MISRTTGPGKVGTNESSHRPSGRVPCKRASVSRDSACAGCRRGGSFLDTLEISPATFKRDLAKLRDQFGMPIVFDRDRRGYVLEAGHRSPLPGMWFSPQELVALATLQQLLVQLQPGLLAATLEPFKQRLGDLLQHEGQMAGRWVV